MPTLENRKWKIELHYWDHKTKKGRDIILKSHNRIPKGLLIKRVNVYNSIRIITIFATEVRQ